MVLQSKSDLIFMLYPVSRVGAGHNHSYTLENASLSFFFLLLTCDDSPPTLYGNFENDRHLVVLFSTHCAICCCGLMSTLCPSMMFVLTTFPGSPGVLDSFIKYNIKVCLCVLGI